METKAKFIYVQPHRENRFKYRINFGRIYFTDREGIQALLINNSSGISKDIVEALNSLIIFVLDCENNAVIPLAKDANMQKELERARKTISLKKLKREKKSKDVFTDTSDFLDNNLKKFL